MAVGISNILALLGGVALFLFGMGLMGDSLKLVAGQRLELILYRLSNTPLKGVLLGTAVTAVIQSSSATSAMVVGFVNSGMMKLSQAIGIVLGANIGTSVTGWILCLSYISSSDALSLLSSATITAIAAIAGILLRMLGKTSQKRHTGDILLGFAVLMYGMNAMSGAVSPLRESEGFLRLMTMFENPILGVLIGTLITAVLQSNSASVGILQALSVTGTISFATAFPMIMGMASARRCRCSSPPSARIATAAHRAHLSFHRHFRHRHLLCPLLRRQRLFPVPVHGDRARPGRHRDGELPFPHRLDPDPFPVSAPAGGAHRESSSPRRPRKNTTSSPRASSGWKSAFLSTPRLPLSSAA